MGTGFAASRIVLMALAVVFSFGLSVGVAIVAIATPRQPATAYSSRFPARGSATARIRGFA